MSHKNIKITMRHDSFPNAGGGCIATSTHSFYQPIGSNKNRRKIKLVYEDALLEYMYIK